MTVEELKNKLDKDFGWNDIDNKEYSWLVDNLLKDAIKAINNTHCCKSDSEQFFLFYKELQKVGRLYDDNLSEDIMKRECDWFVKNK